MPRDANKIYVERLEAKLDAEAVVAMPIALAGDFETAEQMIRTIDCDLYGRFALARMSVAAINSLGGKNTAKEDRSRIRALFERAEASRESAYPTPYTQDEANDYDEARARDRDRVL